MDLVSGGAVDGRVAIPRIHADKLTYEMFCKEYMGKNLPCVITGYIEKNWKAFTTFRKVTASGKIEINLDYLVHKFKNVDVPVSIIDVDDNDLSYQSASNTMPFQTYVNSYYKTSANIERKESMLATGVSPKYFYLKDWHYDIACEAIACNAEYKTPVYFSNDWLNEWWTLHRLEQYLNHNNSTHLEYMCYMYNLEKDVDAKSDFKFLYFGHANTFTPLHHDIYKSYSWSGQIVGTKRWLLYPPNTEDICKGKPTLSKAAKSRTVEGMIEVVQEPGELIFVPSGWYHEVYNETSSVSINHNWINENNIDVVAQHLLIDWKQTTHELRDIKDIMTIKEFVLECNKLMHRNTGMNLYELKFFLDFQLKKYKENADVTYTIQKLLKDINVELACILN